MRIIQLFKIYWPDNGGGIASAIEMISDFFDPKDQKVIVCHEKRMKPSSEDEIGGIRIKRCRHLGFQPSPISLSYIREVRKALKEADEGDLIINHFPYPFTDIALLGCRTKGRLALWWHCDVKRKIGFFYHPLVERSLRRSEIIFVSAKGIIDNTPLLLKYKDKCRVVPFSISEEYIRRGAQVVSGSPRDDDRVNIIFIGRMVWYKGVDILLKAFSKMSNKKCTLTLIGDGPMMSGWQEMGKELGIKDIRWLGKVSEEEKISEIDKSDLMVLPSISDAEAFAIVQPEVMAFGKPVINTYLPTGVPEVSIDGETGITVAAGSVDELAAAMDKLASDSDLRLRYGRNARRRVEENYTREVMKKRFMEAIGETVSEDRI